jgi:hypothetical protein
MTDLFDTEEKRNAAVVNFLSLLEHPGWKLLEQIWEENIEVLRLQLEEGSEDEKKVDIAVIRANLKQLREVKDTPGNLISDFRQEEGEEAPNDDPYPTEAQPKEEEKTD